MSGSESIDISVFDDPNFAASAASGSGGSDSSESAVKSPNNLASPSGDSKSSAQNNLQNPSQGVVGSSSQNASRSASQSASRSASGATSGASQAPAQNVFQKGDLHKANLSLTAMASVPKLLLDKPADYFSDPSYYKTCLTGENEYSKRLHENLSKFLKATDPKDRTVYRQNITVAYWQFLAGMAIKMVSKNLPMPKRMLARFGVLLPSFFRPEQKEFFSRTILDNPYNEPVLYLDEWLAEVASGKMKPSMTDEKRQAIKASSPEEAASMEQARLNQLQSKNSGRMQSAENQLTQKERERTSMENEFKNRFEDLCVHETALGANGHTAPYNEAQTKLLADLMERLRSLSRNNRELSKALDEYKEAKQIFDSVEDKITDTPVDMKAGSLSVGVEFGTVRQMAKMTVGRQGNSFPIFTKDFYHCTERGTGTRENVIELLRWVESIDPGVFCRIHKNIANRIVPYVLLIPTYGDRGFCWEPFDRYNRTTSRGRIVVPMYPRDLKTAVLVAVADLRWQVAKEKASYYWMEEGLTGQYYQHIDRLKLKGDLKAFFIEDYILWMTKESEGTQRLDKEVRGIFWRNMPFPDAKKQELRKRSLVYEDLCQKDSNRAMSDGY